VILSHRKDDDQEDGLRDFREVAAFLRLGNKYEINQLRKNAISVLSREYPTTLEGLDATQDDDWDEAIDPCYVFDIINLARETNTLSLLPAAFYAACDCFDIDEVLDGTEGDNGEKISLSYNDQKTILRGWHTLIHRQFPETFGWMNDLNTDCHTRKKCLKAREKIVQIEFDHSKPDCKALNVWESDWEDDMCESCNVACKLAHNRARADIWAQLPAIFALPDWTTLLED
jgi:hypothetical protein